MGIRKIFSIFTKRECVNCSKKTHKGINYAGYKVCSEECMINFFKNITTKELLKLDKKDKEVNKDFYEWIRKK